MSKNRQKHPSVWQGKGVSPELGTDPRLLLSDYGKPLFVVHGISAREVARRKGCKLDTVLRAIQRGELRAHKVWSAWAVMPGDAHLWTPRARGGQRGAPKRPVLGQPAPKWALEGWAGDPED